MRQVSAATENQATGTTIKPNGLRCSGRALLVRSVLRNRLAMA